MAPSVAPGVDPVPDGVPAATLGPSRGGMGGPSLAPASTASDDAPSAMGTETNSGETSSTPPLVEPPIITVIGKSQEESPYHHPIPEDGALDEYARWLEDGEGLPYPYRKLEWTPLGGPAGYSIAVGPENEIYVAERNESATEPSVARYTAEFGWMRETLPTDTKTFAPTVTELEVTRDGTAWAATNAGLYKRTDDGWAPAPGWNSDYRDVRGVHFANDGRRGVAFLSHDVVGSMTEDAWTRADERSFPLLTATAAYVRSWERWRASERGMLAVGEDEVMWAPWDKPARAYSLYARDAGFGPGGELLVLGWTALLTSADGEDWALYPIQLGGHRGGGLQLDALSVAPAGDAYVSGVHSAMFHRFPDQSVELLSAPRNVVAHDANDYLLVALDEYGVWVTQPRAGRTSSGVFEAVIPQTYSGKRTSPRVPDVVDIPVSYTPPACMDLELTSPGQHVAQLSHEYEPRVVFRAPRAGTYQFRLEDIDEPSQLADYGRQIAIRVDCEEIVVQQGNPLYVAMHAGQYLMFEMFPRDAPASSASNAVWLSIY